MELLIIIVLSLLMVPLVVLTSGALRIILGLAFVLFFPGYTLVAALFPRKRDLDNIQRTALSFGLSIAVVPLIGLVLNYTWEIRVYPILISLLIFIVVMAAIAWYRRQRLMPEERFNPRLGSLLSLLPRSWLGQGRWDRVLTVLLILAVVGAAVTAAYVITKPKAGEKFTEFYVLGPEVKAENYPQRIMLGDKGSVVLGIVNHEHKTTVYRVEITIDAETVRVIGPVTLNSKEKWEQVVDLVPTKAGDKQKAEFLLYKQASGELYTTLHLWIDIQQAP
jgi:uncharacterized membrane protein